ncbi:MAG: hypothetical protein O3C62_06255 [Actinomycetota bacterium]|nr:hypothetical protein [Actinomycetota bacterium]MDA3001268.1 hypothetical protein [Actinomycetota bacterium]
MFGYLVVAGEAGRELERDFSPGQFEVVPVKVELPFGRAPGNQDDLRADRGLMYGWFRIVNVAFDHYRHR